MAGKKPNNMPFTGTYQPFLQTERFDIFHHRIVRNPEMGFPKEIFTAWFREEDVPRSVCEVTLFPNPFGLYVEWVHVCEEYRRQGIATEVMRTLERKFGELDMSGATEAGAGFVAAYRKKHKTATKKKTGSRK
jgi:GNAT superfamily N-acetyltransferase